MLSVFGRKKKKSKVARKKVGKKPAGNKPRYEVRPPSTPPTAKGGHLDITIDDGAAPAPETAYKKSSGVVRAAKLLLALGPEHAGSVLKELDEDLSVFLRLFGQE